MRVVCCAMYFAHGASHFLCRQELEDPLDSTCGVLNGVPASLAAKHTSTCSGAHQIVSLSLGFGKKLHLQVPFEKFQVGFHPFLDGFGRPVGPELNWFAPVTGGCERCRNEKWNDPEINRPTAGFHCSGIPGFVPTFPTYRTSNLASQKPNRLAPSEHPIQSNH